jgi:hypothetical protein
MTMTDPGLEPETHIAPWQTLPRGAKILDKPYDVMWDVDDVLFPTMMSIHDLALKAGLHDGTVTPTWSGWEVYKLPDGSPCPPQVYWDLWSDFALSNGYLDTPPIQEAAEALRRLYFAGHRIHLVTARGFMNHAEEIRRWTREWVEEFGIPWHTLTFARDKVAAQQDVLGTAGYFHYAIDDSPKNFEALWEAGVNAYLLDHDHNKDGVWPKNAAPYRVPTASKFVDIILEEHRERHGS